VRPFDDVELVPGDEGDPHKAIIRAHLQLSPPSVRTFAPWVPESIDELLQSALSKNPRDRPESAHAFATKLYLLQFLGDSPLASDATAPMLQTMTQAAPVSERAPNFNPDGETRQVKPQPMGNDTMVDSSPAGLLELAGVGREHEDVTVRLGNTMPLAPTPVARPAPVAAPAAAPVAGGDHPRPPRSFAEAEAAATARRAGGERPFGVEDIAPRRSSRPPPEESGRSSRTAVTGARRIVPYDPAMSASASPVPTDAGVSRHMSTGAPDGDAARPHSNLTFWLLALGIPAVALALTALFYRVRDASQPAASGVRPPAATSVVMAPLPPEGPTASPEPTTPSTAGAPRPAPSTETAPARGPSK
jgi:hypothetical protein